MSSLENYLRTYRLRAGLSQKEVTALLGCKSSSMISRYERRVRLPQLQTALAYQIILRVPISELFLGAFDQTQRVVAKRVRQMLRKLGAKAGKTVNPRKLEMLRSILITSRNRSRS